MRDDNVSASPHDARAVDSRGRFAVTAVFALAFLATFLVYRPDRNVPFDFVDFSEFLPLLQGDSFFARLKSLLDYYLNHQGRANVVPYAILAAKWGWFGDYSPAWQWLRFGTMWGIILLTFLLLRRIGLARLSSLIGASVFLFAPPAVDGWTRLTMAEPLGTVLVLGACFIAIRPSDAAGGERRIWLGFAAICVIVVLVKEMLAATLLLPLALAVGLSAPLRRYAVQRRVRTLTTAALVGVVVSGVPVAIVALRAKADAYTADFGSAFRPPADVFAEWTLGITPFSVGSSFPPSLSGPALLLFVTLLVAGWVMRMKTSSDRNADRRLLIFGLSFPLIGAATYLPWPSYNRFYAIPFLVGGALLAAGAFAGLQSRSRLMVRAGVAAWSLLLVFAAADAAGQSSRLVVRQRINEAVVAKLSQVRGRVDTVFLATEQRPPTFWQGIGPTLQRYGEALGYPMPRVINASCDDSRRLAIEGSTAVLFYGSLCSNTVTGDTLILRYSRLRLPSLRPVIDSIRVDIVVPVRPAKPAGGAST